MRPAAARPAGDADSEDEPLQTGYLMRPARPDDNGGDGPAADGGGTAPAAGAERSAQRPAEERSGRRGRRRRGERRSRDGRRPASESSSSRSESGGGRRGRRGQRGTERRSSTGLARGRRDDFAPVAGGRDEDDEGLDFLGLEDAGHDGPTNHERPSPDTDDVLAESGLSNVLDVPSWVEAIGIVIAGNLDARSRSPRGDAAPRGGDRGDRGRNDRRGGRAGDPG